jgi:hypothetical protein
MIKPSTTLAESTRGGSVHLFNPTLEVNGVRFICDLKLNQEEAYKYALHIASSILATLGAALINAHFTKEKSHVSAHHR